MRTVYNLINATGKNLGIFSKEKEAETAKTKRKEEGLYILQTFEPETPSEIAFAETESCEFRPTADFKPCSPEAIAQEQNEKDFDTMAGELRALIEAYDDLLSAKEKADDDARKLADILRMAENADCWKPQEHNITGHRGAWIEGYTQACEDSRIEMLGVIEDIINE